jgi:hypothetical protein
VLWGVNWLVLRARGEEGVMKEFDPQALKD